MLSVHAALLDAENRLLLVRRDDEVWDLPGVMVDASTPDHALIAHLATVWQVQSFAKALFPLTFCSGSTDPVVTHLSYGCRNWVGPHGLLQVTAPFDTVWVRPARLLDRPVSPACRDMAPTLMTLIG